MKHCNTFTIASALIAAVLLGSTPAWGQGYWEQTNGPEGGSISSIVVSGISGHVFAGGLGGIFRSTDDGLSWINLPSGLSGGQFLAVSPGGDIFSLAADPTSVMHSTDDGVSWTTIEVGLANPWNMCVFAFWGSSEIYAGIYGGGVVRSTDNGKHWTMVSTGLTNSQIWAFTIRANGDLFAATSSGVFRLTYNSGTWSYMGSPTPEGAQCLAFDAAGSLYSGSGSTIYGGLYRSTNDGGTWTKIDVSAGTDELTDVGSMLIDPAGTIVLSSSGGTAKVFRSSDGTNWTQVTAGLPQVWGGVIARLSTGTLLRGSMAGVYRLPDNGNTWVPSSGGMRNCRIGRMTCTTHGEVFVATYGSGVFRTTNDGEEWTPVNNGLDNFVVNDIVSNPMGDIFITTDKGVMMLPHGQTIWRSANSGLETALAHRMIVNENGWIFAGTIYGGLFRSTDNGMSWQSNNPAISDLSSFAINADGKIYAATGFSGSGDYIYRSTNNGETWEHLTNGITDPAVTAIAETNNGSLLAGTRTAGIFLSMDNGDTWIPSNMGIGSLSVIDFCKDQHGQMYVKTGAGMESSSDNGATWTWWGVDLISIQSLLLSPYNTVLAGTYRGSVYRMVSLAGLEFRSTQSGNWDVPATWEMNIGSSWVPAPMPPPANAGLITIQSGHQVTVAAGVTIEGAAVVVNGYLKDIGGITLSSGNFTFNSGSTYELAHQSSPGLGIPTATWNTSSTCLVTGLTYGMDGLNAVQNFYNLIFDCPNWWAANSDLGWASGNVTIGGDLTVRSTGPDGPLALGKPPVNSTFTVNIMGNLNVGSSTLPSGSTVRVASHNTNAGNTQVTVNVYGNVNVTGSAANAPLTVFYISGGTQANSGTTILNLYGEFSMSNATIGNMNGMRNGGRFVFRKSGTQNLTWVNVTQTSGRIYLEVASGSTLHLNSPLSLGGRLTLSGGIVQSSSSNMLTFGNLQEPYYYPGYVSGGSSSSYIDGPVAYLSYYTAGLPTSFSYPLGKDNIYRPMLLTVTKDDVDATTDDEVFTKYTAELFNASPPTRTLPSTLNRVSASRYYKISKELLGKVTSASVQLSYGAEDNVTQPELLRIVKDDGCNNWLDVGGVGSEPGSGTITSTTNFTSFGDFALGYLNLPPVLGQIAAPVDPIQVNMVVTATATFIDPDDLTGPHTALWNWSDGTISQGVLTYSGGSCTVTGTHTYGAAGVYTIGLTVTDKSGGSGEATYSYVVVFNPVGGFVTGAGLIVSPAGAYRPTPALTGKASFGFVSKYIHGATVPTGNTEFQFKMANLKFVSTSYQWLVVAGSKAQFKGHGTINGEGEYGFMVTAIDGAVAGGGAPDLFRIKIWETVGSESVIYDNQYGEDETSNAATELLGGSIMIRSSGLGAVANPQFGDERKIPTEYALSQNYPNPFNPVTRLMYELPADSKVSLCIYNMLGRVVAILADGIESAGYKQVEWNASNFASSVYFYKLHAVSVKDPGKMLTSVKKMLLVK